MDIEDPVIKGKARLQYSSTRQAVLSIQIACNLEKIPVSTFR
jgi:hypothetical protein